MGGRHDGINRKEGAADARARFGRSSEPIPQPPLRRPYTPPRLEVYGDLRTLTLGGSPGVGDSGGGFSEFPP